MREKYSIWGTSCASTPSVSAAVGSPHWTWTPDKAGRPIAKANCARIGPARAARLHRAIQEVLADAIAQGGSSISNYVNSEGAQGYFQLSTAVYGKTGQPCKACASGIRRILVASRSTHFCPRCQRF